MILIVAATLLVVAVVIYVVSPILQDQHALLRSDEGTSEADARKRAALLALRDAQYDRATGKLDEADYEALKAELSVEALAAMRRGTPDTPRAAEAEPGAPPEPPDEDPGARRAASDEERATAADSAEGRGLEAEIARVRSGLRAGTTCTACAHVNREGSNFCTSCGRPLRRREPARELR